MNGMQMVDDFFDDPDQYLDQFLNDKKDEYTPKEISIAFGCHISTIYNYIRCGKIEAVRRFGYRVPRSSLLSWVKKLTDF
jgi:excisionase family DNA binding protein